MIVDTSVFFFSRALYRAEPRPVRNDESPGKNFFVLIITHGLLLRGPPGKDFNPPGKNSVHGLTKLVFTKHHPENHWSQKTWDQISYRAQQISYRAPKKSPYRATQFSYRAPNSAPGSPGKKTTVFLLQRQRTVKFLGANATKMFSWNFFTAKNKMLVVKTGG